MALPAIAGLIASRRADVLRLLIAEGPPVSQAGAVPHHAEIITPGLALMRRLLARAAELGEIAPVPLLAFPQLVMAPLVMAVVWEGLFQSVDPLDVQGLLRAHVEMLFGPDRRPVTA